MNVVNKQLEWFRKLSVDGQGWDVHFYGILSHFQKNTTSVLLPIYLNWLFMKVYVVFLPEISELFESVCYL